jgi:hypothetical protein
MESVIKLGASVGVACGVCFGGIVNAIDDMQYQNAIENGSLYVLVDEYGKPVSQE